MMSILCKGDDVGSVMGGTGVNGLSVFRSLIVLDVAIVNNNNLIIIYYLYSAIYNKKINSALQLMSLSY